MMKEKNEIKSQETTEKKKSNPKKKKGCLTAIFLVFVIGLIGMAINSCGGSQSNSNSTTTPNASSNIDLSSQKFSFTDFTVEMKSAKVEDDTLFVDFSWRNDSFSGPTTFLRACAGVDGKQGDQRLSNTSKGYNDSKNGDVYFPNAVGGSTDIELTYTLKDTSTPVVLTFVSADDYSSNHDVTINLSK